MLSKRSSRENSLTVVGRARKNSKTGASVRSGSSDISQEIDKGDMSSLNGDINVSDHISDNDSQGSSRGGMISKNLLK